jgi:hypothetical protein
MLYHSACGNPVYIDKSKCIKVLSSFVVLQSSVRLTTGNVISNDKELKPEFFCPTCNCAVPLTDIRGKCDNCGSDHTLEGLFRVNKVPGYYCKSCADSLYPASSKRSLLSILNSIKGE